MSFLDEGLITHDQAFKVIYSRRKTLSLEINLQSELIVRAPQKASMKSIHAFIASESVWILKQTQKMNRRLKAKESQSFDEGEKFLYLGDYYPLKIIENAAQPLRLYGNFELSKEYHNKAYEVFTAWYRKAAREKIQARLDFYAKSSGLSFQTLRLTSAKNSWGSCSASGGINIHWRLIMAPLPVLDYVIIHELSHTKELNHSKRFWQLVSSMMPDYKDQKDWLRDFGQLLTF